jgi:uncharacterized protein YjiS (DUF1127 family)
MDSKQFDNIYDPVARAEAMRAQAIADMILAGVTALRGLFRGASAKLAAYLDYRRTYGALAAMTDRELDDIGIGRSDIDAVARGLDPRKQQAELAAGDALAQRLALAKAFDQDNEVRKPAAQADERRTAAAA